MKIQENQIAAVGKIVGAAIVTERFESLLEWLDDLDLQGEELEEIIFKVRNLEEKFNNFAASELDDLIE